MKPTLIFLLSWLSCQAVVVNDPMGLEKAVEYAKPFDAVVAIGYVDKKGETFIYGTGVLIDTETVLTAHHLPVDSEDLVFFGPDASQPLHVIGVKEHIDDFIEETGDELDNANGTDLALIKLSQPVKDIQPLPIITNIDLLKGKTATVIGYGFKGIGSKGNSTKANTLRHAGQNTVDTLSPEEFGYRWVLDFDNGTEACNEMGSATRLEMEASIAAGDSGGPLLVQYEGEWFVAGITNAGYSEDDIDADYGEVNMFTGLGTERVKEWLGFYTTANLHKFRR